MSDQPSIDGYIIEAELAQGGMGVVYAAEDARLGRKVAIKMIRRDLLMAEGTGGTEAQRDVAAARFLREARVAASIPSNHVATVLQFGETSTGDLYLVLEFLDGMSLRDVLRADGALAPRRAVHIVRQLCRGLAAAHALGVVHRDLKPSNVMLVDQDGDADFVKILDFGVAKLIESQEADLTQTGSMVGTHTAMAPEQIRGEDVDERTDVYASGVLLWRLLCGRSPFRGRDALAILHQHLNTLPPMPSEVRGDGLVPKSLDQIVMRCMAKKKEDRIPSMLDLDRLLHAVEQSKAAPVSMPTRVDPRAKTEMLNIALEGPTDDEGGGTFRDSSPSRPAPPYSGPIGAADETSFLADMAEATPATTDGPSGASFVDGTVTKPEPSADAVSDDLPTSIQRPLLVTASADGTTEALPAAPAPTNTGVLSAQTPRWVFGIAAMAGVLLLIAFVVVAYALTGRTNTGAGHTPLEVASDAPDDVSAGIASVSDADVPSDSAADDPAAADPSPPETARGDAVVADAPAVDTPAADEATQAPAPSEPKSRTTAKKKRASKSERAARKDRSRTKTKTRKRDTEKATTKKATTKKAPAESGFVRVNTEGEK